jgi:hypothetical protein
MSLFDVINQFNPKKYQDLPIPSIDPESNDVADHSSVVPDHSSVVPDHSSVVPDHSSVVPDQSGLDDSEFDPYIKKFGPNFWIDTGIHPREYYQFLATIVQVWELHPDVTIDNFEDAIEEAETLYSPSTVVQILQQTSQMPTLDQSTSLEEKLDELESAEYQDEFLQGFQQQLNDFMGDSYLGKGTSVDDLDEVEKEEYRNMTAGMKELDVAKIHPALAFTQPIIEQQMSPDFYLCVKNILDNANIVDENGTTDKNKLFDLLQSEIPNGEHLDRGMMNMFWNFLVNSNT